MELIARDALRELMAPDDATKVHWQTSFGLVIICRVAAVQLSSAVNVRGHLGATHKHRVSPHIMNMNKKTTTKHAVLRHGSCCGTLGVGKGGGDRDLPIRMG